MEIGPAGQTGRRAPRWLDRKEQRALIRQVQKERNQRDIAIVSLLLHGGLRVEEICHLRLEDVELSERKGKAIVRQGKGGKWRVGAILLGPLAICFHPKGADDHSRRSVRCAKIRATGGTGTMHSSHPPAHVLP